LGSRTPDSWHTAERTGTEGPRRHRATAELAHALLCELATAERRPLPTVGRGEYRSLSGALGGGELHVDGAWFT
jgi:hypothetical protein